MTSPDDHPPIHLDIERSNGIVDSLAVAEIGGAWAAATFSDFMDSFGRDSGYAIDFRCPTQDEPGAANVLMRMLDLSLTLPGIVTTEDINEVLLRLLQHDRWQYCTKEPRGCFTLVAAIVLLMEIFPSRTVRPNVFDHIKDAMDDPRWPFPEHRDVTLADLMAGRPKTLETLCNAVFGSAWWQIVEPASRADGIAECLLSTRPDIVSFVSREKSLDLPDIASDGVTCS